jgi:hypothetical protein
MWYDIKQIKETKMIYHAKDWLSKYRNKVFLEVMART